MDDFTAAAAALNDVFRDAQQVLDDLVAMSEEVD